MEETAVSAFGESGFARKEVPMAEMVVKEAMLSSSAMSRWKALSICSIVPTSLLRTDSRGVITDNPDDQERIFWFTFL